MLTFTNLNTPMVQNYDAEPILTTLENGGLLLYPTDTIWAIGCDATNEEAINRVLALKQWDYSEPFVLLVSSIEMLKDYVERIHPRVETLLVFHERPLTIIYDRAKQLPKNALAMDGSVALRVTKDEFCRSLIENFGKPLVATAACIAGVPFPGHFGEISSAVIEGIDLVVKHRQLDKNMRERSVVARLYRNQEFVFIRE